MPPAHDLPQGVTPQRLRKITADLADVVFGTSETTVSEVADPAACRVAAGIHGIAALLGQRVLAGELSFGNETDTWLTTQLHNNRARLERMRWELLVTLRAFERAGIEIIPLKGSAMLLVDPAAIAWRPMADLDVLVRHPDLLEIDLAFAHAGYCLQGASWKHRVYGPCDPPPHSIHAEGEHPNNPRDIEAHQSVVEMFRGFRWDITPWIVNNLRDAGGACVPSNEAMALHLAVHLSVAVMEATARMVQVFDFARIVDRSGSVAIRHAVHTSGAHERARFVYPAVALAARWTRQPELVTLEAELRPFVPAPLAEWIAGVDFHAISWAGRDERGLLDRLDLWACGPADKARMLAATIAPTPAQLSSAGYPGSGLLAALTWYPRHYRHLLKRVLT